MTSEGNFPKGIYLLIATALSQLSAECSQTSNSALSAVAGHHLEKDSLA